MTFPPLPIPTPGPWFASEDVDADCWIIATAPISPGYHTIPSTADEIGIASDDNLPVGVAEMNARLMAAAPELLEALSQLVTALPLPTTSRAAKAHERACAALAKAKGI